jgi:bifunctional enzyme CysN/CysC
MVTGASTADLAVILIDARKGVLPQTRRHSYLCHLIGIRNIVLAVNKMDLVDYEPGDVFDAIVADYTEFAEADRDRVLHRDADFGLQGRQHHRASPPTRPWYHRPDADRASGNRRGRCGRIDAAKPFRMPVQWVNRPNLDFRGFSGLIATGSVKPGDAIRVLPSGKTSRSPRIVTLDGDLDRRSPASRSRYASPTRSTVRAAM